MRHLGNKHSQYHFWKALRLSAVFLTSPNVERHQFGVANKRNIIYNAMSSDFFVRWYCCYRLCNVSQRQ